MPSIIGEGCVVMKTVGAAQGGSSGIPARSVVVATSSGSWICECAGVTSNGRHQVGGGGHWSINWLGTLAET
jgi:hypothetical protein